MSAQYDALPPSVALGIPQIGMYNGLQYSGWFVRHISPLWDGNSAYTCYSIFRAVAGSSITGGGLQEHSPKQGAVAVTTTSLASNPGTIAVGADVKCFDLLSFYFGCVVVGVGGQASIPIGCAISVSGFRGNTLVGEQAFDFGQPVSFLLLFVTNSRT